ncbi:coproporphyrinogen III oxidase [Halteromyces radiatus]|uniref:coproporphyrinogen III oxidase n=1 Tax=Halteromyces radiatus TaxID=101107 RepID=UPI00221F1849|nr:coproporphyrinogen III oxidase [Halteromyces radiatus]KAI8089115.1 coproporphyrinogen III oxidase [Halteromyces radiatus]
MSFFKSYISISLKSQCRSISTNKSSVPFSIYLHWPYCESKCTYCNFNKYIQPPQVPEDRLKKAMAKEIQYYVNQYQLKHRPLHSIYFGGGTPSLAKPSTLSYLLDTLDHTCYLPTNIEITMEANPTSMELEKLEAFRKIGINRLSLGIQSFDDVALQRMGRDHSGTESIRAIGMAKRSFDNMTFDLIFARPGQTLHDWKKELMLGLDLASNHLSLYQLSLERGTPIYKAVMKGELPPIPNQDEAADMYEMTVELARDHGFHHYEVSNYSRYPHTISRHNFSYWQGMDYLGIGPGAHGRLTDPTTLQRVRTFAEFHPDKYMDLCESSGEGLRSITPISDEQTKEELVVFGLRTKMGIPYRRFESITHGSHLDDMINQEALKLCMDAGFLIQERSQEGTKETKDDLIQPYIPYENRSEWNLGGIRPTEKGLARMDTILPMLLNHS